MGELPTQFSAVLERSPTKGGWTYVVMPDSAVVFGTRGRVKIRGTVEGHPLATSFMALGDGRHKLPIAERIRRAIGRDVGDTVTVRIEERLNGR